MLSRDFEEKRKFMRMAVDCPLTFQVQGEHDRCYGTARDLSSGGLLIECGRELPVGTVLEVKLAPEKAIVPPLEAEVEVARVDAKGPDAYELGVMIREIRG